MRAPAVRISGLRLVSDRHDPAELDRGTVAVWCGTVGAGVGGRVSGATTQLVGSCPGGADLRVAADLGSARPSGAGSWHRCGLSWRRRGWSGGRVPGATTQLVGSCPGGADLRVVVDLGSARPSGAGSWHRCGLSWRRRGWSGGRVSGATTQLVGSCPGGADLRVAVDLGSARPSGAGSWHRYGLSWRRGRGRSVTPDVLFHKKTPRRGVVDSTGHQGLEPRLTEPESVVLPITPMPSRG